MPSIRNRINQELTSINIKFQQDAIERVEGIPFIEALPLNGMTQEEILTIAKRCTHLGK